MTLNRTPVFDSRTIEHLDWRLEFFRSPSAEAGRRQRSVVALPGGYPNPATSSEASSPQRSGPQKELTRSVVQCPGPQLSNTGFSRQQISSLLPSGSSKKKA